VSGQRHGLIDHWLQPVACLCRRDAAELDGILDFDARVNLVCERNVLAQVESLADNPFVRDAWGRGQPLSIHGWIYSIQDGLLRDLETTVESVADAAGPRIFAPKVPRGRPRRGRAA